MLFYLDLSLLEVLLVYTVKMSKKGIFSLFAHISFLQLVTGLLNSNKGGAKGQVLVRGLWVGLVKHPDRDFCPCFSLQIPGRNGFVIPLLVFGGLTDVVMALTLFVLTDIDKDRMGRLVEWVEKASFDRLNKLFMITSNERNHQTLLSDRNLLSIVREPQPYVFPIIPRRLPRVLVLGEHHVLKNLPFYEEAHETDARARQELLD